METCGRTRGSPPCCPSAAPERAQGERAFHARRINLTSPPAARRGPLRGKARGSLPHGVFLTEKTSCFTGSASIIRVLWSCRSEQRRIDVFRVLRRHWPAQKFLRTDAPVSPTVQMPENCYSKTVSSLVMDVTLSYTVKAAHCFVGALSRPLNIIRNARHIRNRACRCVRGGIPEMLCQRSFHNFGFIRRFCRGACEGMIRTCGRVTDEKEKMKENPGGS